MSVFEKNRKMANAILKSYIDYDEKFNLPYCIFCDTNAVETEVDYDEPMIGHADDCVVLTARMSKILR